MAFFYFNCCPDRCDLSCVGRKAYLRKNDVDLQKYLRIEDGTCGKLFYTVFRKATCDVDSMINLHGQSSSIDVKSRLYIYSFISGGLVICMSLFHESLSQSFFLIFAFYIPKANFNLIVLQT